MNEPTRTFVPLGMKHERKRGIGVTPNFWCKQLGGGGYKFAEMRMEAGRVESQEYCFGHTYFDLTLEQRCQMDIRVILS